MNVTCSPHLLVVNRIITMAAAIANSFAHYLLHFRDYHLNVGEFRGQPLVLIRDRTESGQYTWRGITLDEEWDDLMGLQENVQAVLRDLVVQPPTVEDTWVRTIGHRCRRIVVSKYWGTGKLISGTGGRRVQARLPAPRGLGSPSPTPRSIASWNMKCSSMKTLTA